jgi:succinoglycan biosynthesis transport protein ExoP
MRSTTRAPVRETRPVMPGPVGVHSTDETAWRPSPDWIGEATPSGGVGLYLHVVRSRLKLVALIVLVAVGTAALFVAQAPKVYQAEADLLATPIPRDNQNLFGLGLVSESGDPTRDAETLSQVITTPAVAERVRERLQLDRTARSLLRDVTAQPVAQSSIVTIIANAANPELAAQIANAFGRAVIDVRTERMRRLLDEVIPRLRDQLNGLPANEERTREALSGRLRDLETLRLLRDPTLHLETVAAPPSRAFSPRPVTTLAAALIAGLVLGFAVVLGAHLLDPRVEREEDLRPYRIPVLGRIPTKRRRRRPRSQRTIQIGEQLSPATRDAVHRLASSLAARTPAGERAVFVTGAGPGDGKTTTAVNLAAALGALHERVMLVEADPRWPALATTLGVKPGHGLAEVINDHTDLDDALVTSEQLPGVRVLLRDRGDESAPTPITEDGAERLLREAGMHGGWLIVDGPALNYAPGVLPLAKRASRVLIVVRLRSTRSRDLADLAELLTQQGITPDGFILVGVKSRPVYY